MINVNYGSQINVGSDLVGRIIRQGNKYVVYVGASKESFRSYNKAFAFVKSLNKL